MSHSKTTKRGKSLYVNEWNPSAKKYVTTCRLCGKQGYNPSIEAEGFIHPSNQVTNFEHRAIYAELTKVLQPLLLDALGRCEQCAAVMDK